MLRANRGDPGVGWLKLPPRRLRVLIQDTLTLASFCRDLGSQRFIAVDTEFHREKTYKPKLCLVQLGMGKRVAAVDPLARGLDLAPLWELFADQRVLKVFHGAEQDMEVLHYAAGALPNPVYDTQIAAMACGLGQQIGYGALVDSLLGVKLDKGAQFTDWTRRPLSERQLEYALSDVLYLSPVFEKLSQQLFESGRQAWVSAEMAALQDTGRFLIKPEDAWRRLKTSRVSGLTFNIMRELAALREREAIRQDLPRGWVLKDAALLDIAHNPPRRLNDLEKVRGLDSQWRRGYLAEQLIAAVSRGHSSETADAPIERSRPEKPDEELVSLLMSLLRICADKAQVAPKLLASRDEIAAFSLDPEAEHDLLKGWRGEIFGLQARALLQGEIALGVRQGKPQLISTAKPTRSPKAGAAKTRSPVEKPPVKAKAKRSPRAPQARPD